MDNAPIYIFQQFFLPGKEEYAALTVLVGCAAGRAAQLSAVGPEGRFVVERRIGAQKFVQMF